MKSWCTFFLLLFSCSAFSQVEFTGSWKGVLTQNSGGYKSSYEFELYLIQDGDRITGRSYVAVEDIHAVLEIEGKVLKNKLVTFQEVRFIQYSELENMEWCYKSGILQLKRSGGVLRLEGSWVGKTSSGPCVPGKIQIERVKPQA